MHIRKRFRRRGSNTISTVNADKKCAKYSLIIVGIFFTCLLI